jgi:hypothetical protein
MDLLHPEFVHNNIFGFGNSIPPTNVKYYNWKKKTESESPIGLSFDYYSKSFVTRGFTHTKNFHLFVYPSFSWSRVSFQNNHLFIGVNLLPTGMKKTKWFITIRHNFYKTPLQKQLMKIMAASILTQDYCQMLNQAAESDLKQAVLFDKTFEKEEPVLQIHRLFTENYKYVDAKDCVELYEHFNNKSL